MEGGCLVYFLGRGGSGPITAAKVRSVRRWSVAEGSCAYVVDCGVIVARARLCEEGKHEVVGG